MRPYRQKKQSNQKRTVGGGAEQQAFRRMGPRRGPPRDEARKRMAFFAQNHNLKGQSSKTPKDRRGEISLTESIVPHGRRKSQGEGGAAKPGGGGFA